jgi:protein-tyrosine-phosphatase
MQIGLYMVGALDDTIAGKYDTNLDTLNAWAKQTKAPMFLRIGYEFDNTDNNYNPQKYQEAYRYIVDYLRSHGNTNIAFVWHSGAFKNPTTNIKDYYPGDKYVDWAAVSVFGAPDSRLDPMVQFAKEHKLPLMIAESGDTMGANATIEQKETQYYNPLFQFIKDNNIKMFCYPNVNWDKQDNGKNGTPDLKWGNAQVQQDPNLLKFWINNIKGYVESSKDLFKSMGFDIPAAIETLRNYAGKLSRKNKGKTPILPPLSAQEKINKIREHITKDSKTTLCFVCNANENRSALAHVLMQDALQKAGKKNISVISGGMISEEKKTAGNGLKDDYKSILSNIGINSRFLNGFKSRQFTQEHTSADWIIAADNKTKEMLLAQYPGLYDKVLVFSDINFDLEGNVATDVFVAKVHNMVKTLFPTEQAGEAQLQTPLVDGVNADIPSSLLLSEKDGKIDKVVVVTDYVNTVSKREALKGEYLDAFVNCLINSDLLVLDTGEDLSYLLEWVLKPVTEELKKRNNLEQIKKLIIMYNSGDGALGFDTAGNRTDYWQPKTYENPDERKDMQSERIRITEAMISEFYDALKTSGFTGSSYEQLEGLKQEYLAKFKAESNTNIWQNASAVELFELSIVPDNFPTGAVTVRDSGNKLTLELVHTSDKFTEFLQQNGPAFVASIKENVQRKSNPKKLTYFVGGPTYLDIGRSNKKDGFLRLMQVPEARAVLSGKTAVFCMGDSQNDFHLTLANADLKKIGISAECIPIFVGQNSSLPQGAKDFIATKDKNTQGGLTAIRAIIKTYETKNISQGISSAKQTEKPNVLEIIKNFLNRLRSLVTFGQETTRMIAHVTTSVNLGKDIKEYQSTGEFTHVYFTDLPKNSGLELKSTGISVNINGETLKIWAGVKNRALVFYMDSSSLSETDLSEGAAQIIESVFGTDNMPGSEELQRNISNICKKAGIKIDFKVSLLVANDTNAAKNALSDSDINKIPVVSPAIGNNAAIKKQLIKQTAESVTMAENKMLKMDITDIREFTTALQVFNATGNCQMLVDWGIIEKALNGNRVSEDKIKELLIMARKSGVLIYCQNNDLNTDARILKLGFAGIISPSNIKHLDLGGFILSGITPNDVLDITIPEAMSKDDLRAAFSKLSLSNTMIFHSNDAERLIGETRSIIDKKSIAAIFNVLLNFGKTAITTPEMAQRLGYNCDTSSLPKLSKEQLKAFASGNLENAGISLDSAIYERFNELKATTELQKAFITAVTGKILIIELFSKKDKNLARDYTEGKYRLNPIYENILGTALVFNLTGMQTGDGTVILKNAQGNLESVILELSRSMEKADPATIAAVIQISDIITQDYRMKTQTIKTNYGRMDINSFKSVLGAA